jgi:hypothetical protein
MLLSPQRVWRTLILFLVLESTAVAGPPTNKEAQVSDPALWCTWAARDHEVPAPRSTTEGVRSDGDEVTASKAPPENARQVPDEWSAGTVVAWNALARRIVGENDVSPPEAARLFCLVSIAMYDSIVLCARAGARRTQSPADAAAPSRGREVGRSAASERAAVSTAAAAVLGHLRRSGRLRGKAASEIESRLQAAIGSEIHGGRRSRQQVYAGSTLGALVAADVVDASDVDGSAGAQSGYSQSTSPGRWRPICSTIGSDEIQPLLPGWGKVRTWVLKRGNSLRPDAPPAFRSAEWDLLVDEVYSVSRSLTAGRRAIAQRWAGGVGTETAAGMWNAIACDHALAAGLSEADTARILALLGVAQHDAFVACWDCKFAYDCCRPVTDIRNRLDPAWRPLLETPPFPSFPSGHAATSGAASIVLSRCFPGAANEILRMATEAKESRLYGGIHTRIDNEVGMDLGRAVGLHVLEEGDLKATAQPSHVGSAAPGEGDEGDHESRAR